MSYHYIFPTAIFEDTQTILANELLPIANNYLDIYGTPFLENPNHISTSKNKIESSIINDSNLKLFLDYVYKQCDNFLEFGSKISFSMI